MESILWVDGEYYGLLVKFRRFTQFATSRTHGHEGPILVSCLFSFKSVFKPSHSLTPCILVLRCI